MRHVVRASLRRTLLERLTVVAGSELQLLAAQRTRGLLPTGADGAHRRTIGHTHAAKHIRQRATAHGDDAFRLRTRPDAGAGADVPVSPARAACWRAETRTRFAHTATFVQRPLVTIGCGADIRHAVQVDRAAFAGIASVVIIVRATRA
jgi:hypothetical protein